VTAGNTGRPMISARARPAGGSGRATSPRANDVRAGKMAGMERGERMLIPCAGGGPCTSRLENYPPPLEIQVRGGMYILVDDGLPDRWRYDWVPDRP